MKMIAAIAAALVGLATGTVQAGDLGAYEGSLRAASHRYRVHRADCNALGARLESPALCQARARAEFDKAEALARARFKNTRKEWDAASRTILGADARLARIERGRSY